MDTLPREQIIKPYIQMQRLLADPQGLQNPDLLQFLEILSGGLSLGDPCVDQKLAFGIGLVKELFDQFLEIYMGWQFLPGALR